MNATQRLICSPAFVDALRKVGLEAYADRAPVLEAKTDQQLANALNRLAEKDGIDVTVISVPMKVQGFGVELVAGFWPGLDCDITTTIYILTEASVASYYAS